jgi:proline dehydrogenase
MAFVSRTIFRALAASKGMKTFASKYGFRHDESFARRFVVGDSVDDAIAAARATTATNLRHSLDYLGPGATSMTDADTATRKYIGALNDIAAANVERHVALKLTQLGLPVDRATCVDNLRRVLDAASAHGFFVRIHMEDSRYTQVTLDIFETLWQQGYRNAGPAVQAYLPRSMNDARRLIALGAAVRLVKGSYKEPRGVAYRSHAQVDAAFVEIMKLLMIEGTSPAIATHDPAMIDATRAVATERHMATDRYEFEMYYGIRPDLQRALAGQGYRVRVYIPFGPEWFPYLMRRLGERRAGVRLVATSVLARR